jgi:M6 family metalloprotease-like protein
MKILRIVTVTRICLAFILLMVLVANTSGQLWLDKFAHPQNRHPGGNGPVGSYTSELFQDLNKDVNVPVLVVLMEFTDVHAEKFIHDANFFSDLMFGINRPRPSAAEVIQENTNGRLRIIPATQGDQHGPKDGIVGWLTTPYTFNYWFNDIEGKRAEAIRVADPFFDYSHYDTNSPYGVITPDELTVVLVNADDTCCDQHLGHPNVDPNCTIQSGGNCRWTDPPDVNVEGGTLVVRQGNMAGLIEQADVGVFYHELGHHIFGLDDLYLDGNMRNDPTYLQVADGYFFQGEWYPPPADSYSFMANSEIVNRINHLDPWAKIHLGFTKPLVVTHDGTYVLYDAETERNFSVQSTQPEAVIIYDPNRSDPYNEYFILENRNQATLPDQGLAVWLIDEDPIYNNNKRKIIRFIRRNGYWGLWGDVLWDGSSVQDGYDLTPDSIPRNTNWTDGTNSYIEIYDISLAGPIMEFKVRLPGIFVDKGNTGFENGTQQQPYNQVTKAIAAINEPPTTIRIAGGNYQESLRISTPCTLMGWRNGNPIIGQ